MVLLLSSAWIVKVLIPPPEPTVEGRDVEEPAVEEPGGDPSPDA